MEEKVQSFHEVQVRVFYGMFFQRNPVLQPPPPLQKARQLHVAVIAQHVQQWLVCQKKVLQ